MMMMMNREVPLLFLSPRNPSTALVNCVSRQACQRPAARQSGFKPGLCHDERLRLFERRVSAMLTRSVKRSYTP